MSARAAGCRTDSALIPERPTRDAVFSGNLQVSRPSFTAGKMRILLVDDDVEVAE